MKKEEFENIVNLQSDLKEQPNSKLIEVMDILSTEFDLTKEKEATALFLDLIENGFYPQSAFNTVQKECLEAGEIF
jgi:hypothetical protein